MRCSAGHETYDASCVDCLTELPPPARPVPPEAINSRPFKARIDSICPKCEEPVAIGQTIGHTNRDRYLHLDCIPVPRG